MTINLPTIMYDPITKRFTQLDDPPGRPHKIELTEKDKARLIKDFKELIKRGPTEEEVETLLTEERKIKRGLTEMVFINPEKD